MNFILIKTINLDNFDVNLYKFDDYAGPVVSDEFIQNNLIALNNQETAIELAQLVSSFDGVTKIAIYDKNNILLLEVAESL